MIYKIMDLSQSELQDVLNIILFKRYFAHYFKKICEISSYYCRNILYSIMYLIASSIPRN